MKKIIDYGDSDMQMGDLIRSQGVSPRKDFTPVQMQRIRKKLERYLTLTQGDKPVEIDLGKFVLRIKGYDEAGYLIHYLF